VLFAGLRLRGAWRSAAIAYQPMALAVILSLDSGAGLLGLIAGGVAFALAMAGGLPRLRLPTRILSIALFAAALAVIGWMFAHAPPPPPIEELSGPRYDGPIETPLPLVLLDGHRQQIWGFSLKAMQSAPLFGHGLRTSNLLPGAHVKIGRYNQEFVPSHPHNWIIEILVDSGFVGFAGVLGVLVVLAWSWLTVMRVDRVRAAAGFGVMAAFLSSSLLNFSVWSAWWQTEFFVLSAILLALPPPAPRAAAASNR
jgi:O-antigen ligase